MGIKTLKCNGSGRLERHQVSTGGLGTRKLEPIHAEGKLRKANLESAPAGETWLGGQVGNKPLSGSKPGKWMGLAARLCPNRFGWMCCGDAKPQESDRGRTRPVRRTGHVDSQDEQKAKRD